MLYIALVRARAAAVTLAVAGLTLAGAAIGPGAFAAGVGAAASAAHVLDVHDEGHLKFIRASGSQLLDEGHVTGTFPGKVQVHFVYDGQPNVTARFTITGSAGSVSARGSARLSSPTTPTPSFRGKLTVTSGTGRYAHIHGAGELFGVFNRRSYALTVQAIAKLPY
jgi:hypothetical protein